MAMNCPTVCVWSPSSRPRSVNGVGSLVIRLPLDRSQPLPARASHPRGSRVAQTTPCAEVGGLKILSGGRLPVCLPMAKLGPPPVAR